MRLFHEREYPRAARLVKSDEQECYSAEGKRKGVWLTSQQIDGPLVLCFDAPEGSIAEYEVTKPGEEARTFVVPFTVAQDFAVVE
jgi:hypothetical protein